MKAILLTFLLLSHLSSFASEVDPNAFGTLLKQVERVQAVVTGKPCNDQLNIDRSITKKTLKDLGGKEFEIAEVGPDYLNEIFDYLSSQKHIPFRYPENGCHSRAHEMVRLLEEKGVLAGKAYIEGDLRIETTRSPKGYVEWTYHVAPILSVKGKLFVIDPSIFDKPVPLEEWQEIQTRKSKIPPRTVFTPRFHYDAVNLDNPEEKYSLIHTLHMKSRLSKYMKIQNEREASK